MSLFYKLNLQNILQINYCLKTSRLMSIYSGFATRQLQQTYDHCLNSLLYILQKRILKFYNNQKTDEYKFANLVQKMYLQMKHMEKSKYLDPKCSYAVQQLFEYLIKQNNTDNNATIQQNSVNQDSLKHQVYKKRPLQQKSIQSSQINQTHNKQKTYQIPIRSQNTSPNRATNNNLYKRNKFVSSSSTSKHIGKITNSRSKQKPEALTINLQQGKNIIRQRTPSTSHGSRLIRQNKIVPHKQKQQLLYRNRNYSFNQGKGMISSKKFQKSSARVQPQNISNSFSLKQQNQIHDIIKDYIQKTKRVPSATYGNKYSSKQISREQLQVNSKIQAKENSKLQLKQKSWVQLRQNSKIQVKQNNKNIVVDEGRNINKKPSRHNVNFNSVSREKNFVSG